MKQRITELGEGIWYSILAIIVVAILSLGALAIQRVVYPWWLSIQRVSVEESKSFTDANNNMLETYKLEHGRLDVKIAETSDEDTISVYQAQQYAIIEKMCRQISTMQVDTVAPATLQWLNSKGGCR